MWSYHTPNPTRQYPDIISDFSLSLLLQLLLSHFSRVWLCATLETSAHQASPSLGFSRQEHWSGLPFPSSMHESEKWKWSCSVVSDPQQPHGLQPTRLLRPWDFPGKSTGVGCHHLLCSLLLPQPKDEDFQLYLLSILPALHKVRHFIQHSDKNKTILQPEWNSRIVNVIMSLRFRLFRL